MNNYIMMNKQFAIIVDHVSLIHKYDAFKAQISL